MQRFKELFPKKTSVIAMIHVHALPGTPKNSQCFDTIIETALKECELYKDAAVDGIMIENMHDVPYMNNCAGPEITAAMSVIGRELKKTCDLPIGIQILAGANKEALAAAYCAGLDFIRAEGFVFSHVADEGFIDSCAGELLRYRKAIGADNILVFTDIKKKHCSHSITNDVSIAETAHAAEFFLSDGVIITGASTGTEAEINEIADVKNAVSLPVLVGSGVTTDNVSQYAALCDALIVGSHFKYDGYWENDINVDVVKKFMDKVSAL